MNRHRTPPTWRLVQQARFVLRRLFTLSALCHLAWLAAPAITAGPAKPDPHVCRAALDEIQRSRAGIARG